MRSKCSAQAEHLCALLLRQKEALQILPSLQFELFESRSKANISESECVIEVFKEIRSKLTASIIREGCSTFPATRNERGELYNESTESSKTKKARLTGFIILKNGGGKRS